MAPLDSAHFRRWFGESVVVDASGAPMVVFHGTQTPETLTAFEVGGRADSVRSGDAYGIAAYFTSSPSEASFYARESGAVLPVYITGEILDIDGTLSPDQGRRLTELGEQLLLPSDRARFPSGRAERSFDAVEDARECFENQRLNWEHFGDGMDRARPEASVDGGRFIVRFTDYDAPVPIRSGADAATMFAAIGWENLMAAGFDGIRMTRGDGTVWVAMHRTAGLIKSALGATVFDPADPDITDLRTASARRALALITNERRTAAPHA